MALKRQFGVYYPDKSKDFIALKVMEKVRANREVYEWEMVNEKLWWMISDEWMLDDEWRKLNDIVMMTLARIDI